MSEVVDRVAPDERRRHARIAPKGTMILLAGEHAQRGRIANISEGGLLATTLVTAPLRLIGRSVEMELRLDGQLAHWMRASGRIVRIGEDGLALSFVEIPAQLVQLIRDMTSASHTRHRRLTVLLIDANRARRATMSEGFRQVGCDVVEISTPLEAIVRLGEVSFEPDLIAIADSLPSSTAEELREFVDREHPNVKLLKIGDDLAEPEGMMHWLSSADPDSDLASRVRFMLGRPRRS